MALIGLLLCCQFFGTPEHSVTPSIGGRDPIVQDFDADGYPDLVVNNMFLNGILGEFGLQSSRTGVVYRSPTLRPMGTCVKVWMGKFTPGNTIDFLTLICDTTDPVFGTSVYLHSMSAPGIFSMPILVGGIAQPGSYTALGVDEYIDAQGITHLVTIGTRQVLWARPQAANVDITIDGNYGINVSSFICPLAHRVKHYKTLQNQGIIACDLENKVLYIENIPTQYSTTYLTQSIIADMEVIDMDLDGNDDILIYDTGDLWIYYLDTFGGIRNSSRIPLVGVGAASTVTDISLGFVDGDNVPDIAEYINDGRNNDAIRIYLSTANYLNPVVLDLGIVGYSYSIVQQIELGRIKFKEYGPKGSVLASFVLTQNGGYIHSFIYPLLLSNIVPGTTYTGTGGIEVSNIGRPILGSKNYWLIIHNSTGGDIVPIVGQGQLNTPITPWTGLNIYMQNPRFALNQNTTINNYFYYSLPVPSDSSLLNSRFLVQIFGLGQIWPLSSSGLLDIYIQ